MERKADLLETKPLPHMCYLAERGRSALQCVVDKLDINRGEPKIRERWGPSLAVGVADTHRNTPNVLPCRIWSV